MLVYIPDRETWDMEHDEEWKLTGRLAEPPPAELQMSVIYSGARVDFIEPTLLQRWNSWSTWQKIKAVAATLAILLLGVVGIIFSPRARKAFLEDIRKKRREALIAK